MKTLLIVIILTLLPLSCSVRADSLATMVGVGGMGYDPDLYYIESIDTIMDAEDGWLWLETDTTWAKYVTGKFTKRRWDKINKLLDMISFKEHDVNFGLKIEPADLDSVAKTIVFSGSINILFPTAKFQGITSFSPFIKGGIRKLVDDSGETNNGLR